MRLYTVCYRLTRDSEIKKVLFLANTKTNAEYFALRYIRGKEGTDVTPYKYWLWGVTYKNGKLHYFCQYNGERFR